MSTVAAFLVQISLAPITGWWIVLSYPLGWLLRVLGAGPLVAGWLT